MPDIKEYTHPSEANRPTETEIVFNAAHTETLLAAGIITEDQCFPMYDPSAGKLSETLGVGGTGGEVSWSKVKVADLVNNPKVKNNELVPQGLKNDIEIHAQNLLCKMIEQQLAHSDTVRKLETGIKRLTTLVDEKRPVSKEWIETYSDARVFDLKRNVEDEYNTAYASLAIIAGTSAIPAEDESDDRGQLMNAINAIVVKKPEYEGETILPPKEGIPVRLTRAEGLKTQFESKVEELKAQNP